MSGSHPGPRTPPERLAELAALLDDDATRATFTRGLAIGALVGAAIAGGLLRGRRRRRRAAREVSRIETPDGDTAPGAARTARSRLTPDTIAEARPRRGPPTDH